MSVVIRVLHIVSSLGTGSGVMSVLMSYHRKIDRSRVQFDYLATREAENTFEAEILALGGRVYHLPRPSLTPEFRKQTEEFFRAHGGECPVVHAHPIYASAIFGKTAVKYGVKRVIQHSHTSKYSANPVSAARNFATLALFGRRATDFAACSGVAKKMFFWKKPEEVYLMRNAIDLEKFTFSGEKRNAIREALGIGRDALVLGHVGRFAKEKNHSFLLDVFSRLRKLQPEARLLLLGDGELFEAVKAEAARAGLADGVIFAGRQADVGAYMSAMDVFVMPSLFEGLGIVLIEAQANGLPCVASDQVPLETKASELIEYLPLRGDVDRWVEAVQGKDRLLGRPAALEAYEIGGAAEELVEYYERFI